MENFAFNCERKCMRSGRLRENLEVLSVKCDTSKQLLVQCPELKGRANGIHVIAESKNMRKSESKERSVDEKQK